MRKKLTLALALALNFALYAQMHNGHEYVDLGLPSGNKWATCNIGASSPEEFGDYFAWGEIEYNSKSEYSRKTYVYKKYPAQLPVDRDIAHVLWGGEWRIASTKDFLELIKNCEKKWFVVKGKTGCKFTGPNGNYIFLPAAGNKTNKAYVNNGMNGYYWTNKLNTTLPEHAYYLHFFKDKVSTDYWSRAWGLPVRAVFSSSDAIMINDEKKQSNVSPEIKAETANDGTNYNNTSAILDFIETNVNGHEYVDLGLPSGNKWATCNIGASSPEEFGNYYSWGEVEPKLNYNEETYNGCSMEWYPENDAASVNWGEDWCIPGKNDWDELGKVCKFVFTKYNNQYGYKIIGPNDNYIFLPSASKIVGTSLFDKGSAAYSTGNYWSSTDNQPRNTIWTFYFYHSGHRCVAKNPYDGLTIRAVCKK